MAADVDDVAEAARRDHPGDRALVLQHRVRRNGRAVEDAGDVRRREAGVARRARDSPVTIARSGSAGVEGTLCTWTPPDSVS